MTDDVLRCFDAFTEAVRARLTMGAEAYSATPAAARPMPELASEIQDELADVAGWSACLWVRLESLRTHIESSLQQQCNSGDRAATPEPPEPLVFRMVGAERTG